MSGWTVIGVACGAVAFVGGLAGGNFWQMACGVLIAIVNLQEVE